MTGGLVLNLSRWIVALTIGALLGAWSLPVTAQTAMRLFGTLEGTENTTQIPIALVANSDGELIVSGAGGGGTPGGANGDIQFNDMGTFGGLTPGTGVATALAANVTGSGGIVLATSPTLVTPTLGAATYTTLSSDDTSNGGIRFAAAGGRNPTLYWNSGNSAIRISDNGDRYAFQQGVLVVPAYGLGSLSTPDVVLIRDAAAILAQRNSTAAQSFRAYYSYTDASNYARLALNTGSTAMTLAAETAGTGADDINVALVPAGTGLVFAGATGTGTFKGAYQSSDGTAGVTVTTCTGFKDGLCISGT